MLEAEDKQKTNVQHQQISGPPRPPAENAHSLPPSRHSRGSNDSSSEPTLFTSHFRQSIPPSAELDRPRTSAVRVFATAQRNGEPTEEQTLATAQRVCGVIGILRARCSDAALTVAKLAQDKDIAASSVINAMLEAEEEFRAFRAQEKERLKQEKAGKAAKEKEEKERLKKEKAEKVAKDKEDKDRMTALGLATKGGHHAAVQLLLKAGADLTAKNKVSLKRGTLRHPSHRSEVHAGGAGPSNLTRISHDFCCSSGHDCPL